MTTLSGKVKEPLVFNKETGSGIIENSGGLLVKLVLLSITEEVEVPDPIC